MLNKKEKREIGIIFACVFLVVLVGLFVTFYTERKAISTGQAISAAAPSYSGVIEMLQNNCAPSLGNGSCNSLCSSQEKVCLPIENNCELNLDNNQCLCCAVPR